MLMSSPAVVTFDCYGTLIDWESGILEDARLPVDQRPVAVEGHDGGARHQHHTILPSRPGAVTLFERPS